MGGGELFLFLICGDGLQVLCLENLTAIQAFDVIDSVAPGNHLGTGMVASGLHNNGLDRVYFNRLKRLVKAQLRLETLGNG
jgi:hypothetical protein